MESTEERAFRMMDGGVNGEMNCECEIHKWLVKFDTRIETTSTTGESPQGINSVATQDHRAR